MGMKIKLLAIFLIGIALTIVCGRIFFNPDKAIADGAKEDIEKVKNTFYLFEDRDTAFLSVALESVISDQKLKELYLGRDRDNMYVYGQPVFWNLRNKYDVIQLNFILPNGTIFARMQDKELYGDTITRASFQAARASGSLVTGIEPGKTGYSMRAVAPYYGGNGLIGYVEIGKDMNAFLTLLKGKSSDEFAYIAEKSQIDRNSWIAMRKLSGRRNNWDDMQNYVVAGSTTEEIDCPCFTDETMARIKAGGTYIGKMMHDDRTFACGGFTVTDASGRRPIGIVFTLLDITDEERASQKASDYSVAASAIIFISVFAALIFILGVPQKQVGEQQGASAQVSGLRKLSGSMGNLYSRMARFAAVALESRPLAAAFILLVAAAAAAGVSYYEDYSAVHKAGNSSSASDTNGITDSEILIGSSSALSGSAQLLGTRYLNGSMAYIKKINEDGGINGRKIRVIAYDDQYDPPKTVFNTQKLIQSDNVFLLFDYVGTPTSVRIVNMVDEAKIPVFGLFTGAEELRNPLRKYIFNVRASYYDETGAAVDYFVGKKGLNRIAVFYQDDAFGQTGLKGTEIALKRYGLSPVAKGTYTRGSTAVESGLEAIRVSNPEAIIMIGTYTPLAKFVNLYKKEMYDPYFHTVSFVGAEAFASKLSEYGINSSEKIIVTEVVPDPHTASSEYIALSEKYFPEDEITYTGLEGYVNAVFLVNALQRAGRDLNREKFINEVESMRNEDIMGISATFGPDDHQAFDKIYFSHLTDSRFDTFEPK